MALQAGKSSYAGSMAAMMEQVFNEQLANGQPKPSEQMKTLFIAVAEGVVRHMVAHPEAFRITVTEEGNDQRHNVNLRISSTDTY